MAQGGDATHLSARVPSALLDDLDKVAAVLERSRSWVVVRALQRYLDDEGAELLREAESLAELDRTGGHDLGHVLDEADAIISAAKRAKRRTRAAE